jgi:predicted thioesterase
MSELAPGLSGTVERLVEMKYCTTRGQYDIFSTPNLVLLIEETAIDTMQPLLPETQSTVGTTVNIAHVAATLKGQKVWATTTVKEVIATGTHERFIVDLDKFEARLGEKAASLG